MTARPSKPFSRGVCLPEGGIPARKRANPKSHVLSVGGDEIRTAVAVGIWNNSGREEGHRHDHKKS